MTLYVVYVPETGHVVGAVTAIGAVAATDAVTAIGAVAATDAASLIGDALPLRVSVGPGEITTIPLRAGRLAVHAPDDEPGVFPDPLAFGVQQVEGATPKPALIGLKTWHEELTFTPDSLVITVTVADGSQDTPVLALISVGQEILVRPGTLPAGQDTIELPVTVPAGTYGVLALVGGWTGALKAVTKT